MCTHYWVEKASPTASSLQVEVNENVVDIDTRWLFTTLDGENGAQHYVAHSSIYMWVVLTLTMIGLGLVLMGCWLCRSKFSQCCMLGSC